MDLNVTKLRQSPTADNLHPLIMGKVWFLQRIRHAINRRVTRNEGKYGSRVRVEAAKTLVK